MANTGEDVDEILDLVPGRRDGCVEDCDDEEDDKGQDERRFEVFKFGCVEPRRVRLLVSTS